MNSRLEAVEVQVAKGNSDKQVKWRRTGEQSKISSCNNDFVNVRKPGINLQISSCESESDVDSQGNLPNLATLRSSVEIQQRVDSRLKQLERMQQASGNDNSNKIKSKRGGAVDIIVKHKVTWPHEAILCGANRTLVTYDQLSLSQWVQGFAQNILDETDNGKLKHMISYISLLGSLLYMHKWVKPVRCFLNRILDVLCHE